MRRKKVDVDVYAGNGDSDSHRDSNSTIPSNLDKNSHEPITSEKIFDHNGYIVLASVLNQVTQN